MLKINSKYTLKELIEGSLFLVDKDRKKTPFILNSIQNKFFENQTNRDLVLKSRKVGISSFILAEWLIFCLTEDNTNAVVISHEKEATRKLFEKVYFYLDNLPIKPKMNKESVDEMKFPETRSSFYIGTAGSKAFGRGSDISHLHISELDFWENTDMLTGVFEACIPTANIIIETTANGFNSPFHQLWQKAKNKQSNWTPHFFGWNEDLRNSIPIENKGFILTSEETRLKKVFNLTNEQINWKRNKVKEMPKPELFCQEQPINDVEAFLFSGRTYFNTERLQKYLESVKEPKYIGDLWRKKDKVEFVPDTKGHLKIWQQPEEDKNYVIGSDVAEGLGLDFNTAVVREFKSKDIVATLKLDISPAEFGRELSKLGQYYNWAFIGCEVNNHGLTTLTVLNEQEKYTNLYYRRQLDKATNEETEAIGFKTTKQSKPLILDELNKSIMEGSIAIPSKDVIEELLSFVIDKDGKAGAQSGANDDYVMALAISEFILPFAKFVIADWDEVVRKHNNSSSERGKGGYG